MDDNYLVYINHFNLQQNNKLLVSRSNNNNSSSYDIQTEDLTSGDGAIAVNLRKESKIIQLDGVISESTDGEELENILKAFDKNLYQTIDNINYLRIVPHYTTWDITESTTGWTAGSDFSSLGTSTATKQTGSKSLSMTYNPAGSGDDFGTLAYTGATGLDLTDSNGIGGYAEKALHFSVYIPNVYYIEDLEVRIGNDASNYYSLTVNSPFRGGFKKGWNHFAIPISSLEANETGTVSDDAIDYFYIKLTHDSAATISDTVYVDGIMFADEDTVRNYRGYQIGSVNRESNSYNVGFSTQILEFNNLTGYAESTFDYELFNETGISSVSEIISFNAGGSTTQLPTHSLTINTSTDIDNISIKDLDNNKTFTILASSIADADTFQVGKTVDGIVRQNGLQADGDGFALTASPGWNLNQLQVTEQTPTLLTNGTVTTGEYTRDPGTYAGTALAARYAQSFTTTFGNIAKVKVRMRDIITGTSMRLQNLEIWSDSSGSPNAFVSKITSTNHTFNSTMTDIEYNVSIALTPTTNYWLVWNTGAEKTNYYTSGGGGISDSKIYTATATGGSGTLKYQLGSGVTPLYTYGSWVTVASTQLWFELTEEITPAWDIDWSARAYKLYST